MIFYRSFFEAMRGLDHKTKSILYEAIFDYGLNFQEPELTGVAKTIWTLIKPNLDANIRKFENGSKGASHGSKGGRPTKGQANPKETPEQPLTNPNPTPNVNGNGNGNEDEDFDANEQDLFETFWSLYDKGVSRVPSQREWSQIDPREYPKIIAHVPKYVQATPLYRKDPINYLKDRVWTDTQLPNQSSPKAEPVVTKFIPRPPQYPT
jgi:hypothetical protein